MLRPVLLLLQPHLRLAVLRHPISKADLHYLRRPQIEGKLTGGAGVEARRRKKDLWSIVPATADGSPARAATAGQI
jgi:hypothetical protein